MADLRLLLDADVALLLAKTLRLCGHDVVHAGEANLRAAHDQIILREAVAQGRAVLTHNIDDYARLAREYAREARPHAGIVFAKQQPFRDLLRRTVTLLRDHAAEDLAGVSMWLPR